MMHRFEFIEKIAKENPAQIAFADNTQKVTYRDLDMVSRKLAAVLRGRGIKYGELVAVTLPTHLSWLTTITLHRMGAITMSKNNSSDFSREAVPDWIISGTSHRMIPEDRTLIFNSILADEVEKAMPEEFLTGYSKPTDVMRLISTSGTTGSVKYIARSAGELLQMTQLDGSSTLAAGERTMSLFPLGAAQTYRLMLQSLVSGSTFYSFAQFDNGLLRSVEKYKINKLIGSPAQFSKFLDIQHELNLKLPTVQSVVMGGSAPTEKLIERIKKQIECTIINAYGSTEVGNVGHQDLTNGRVEGLAINPLATVEIVDDNDAILPPGTIGKIRYKRAGMTSEYYKNPTATAENFKDGYFYPGDLGLINQSGQLVLHGRVNEVINLGGVKIDPSFIDSVAISQLGVVNCATFNFINLDGNESLALAVVIDEDFDLVVLQKTLAQKTPYPVAAIEVMGSIPRNENGKVLRYALREGFERRLAEKRAEEREI